MSQISPPIRILLVCALGFLGAYTLFLRPKAETIPPVEPAPHTQTNEPAVSGPGKIAESAKGAVDATNSQLSGEESVDGVDKGETAAATKTGSEATAQKGEAAAAEAGLSLSGVPKPVANAIRKQKVLVLLFWNGKSADDKAVHKALANVYRWKGRVAVEAVSIKKISRYGRVAQGVDVEQSPTVVVADAALRAETLVGYVDAATINQAVVDALRATGPLYTDAYLRKVDAVCVHHSNKLAAIPNYYGGGSVKKADARLTSYDAAFQAFADDFAAVKAPKKWRAFKAAAVRDIDAGAAVITRFSGAVSPKASRTSVVAAQARYDADSAVVAKRLNKRMDGQGLFRCGSAS